jgi:hypothetical protein
MLVEAEKALGAEIPLARNTPIGSPGRSDVPRKAR